MPLSSLLKMGVNESLIKSLSEPCEKTVHDCQKYTMDDMECSSDCSRCCSVHLKTHPHKADEDDEYESIESENGDACTYEARERATIKNAGR